MTEPQQQQKKTRRKLPRRNIIDSEFVSSAPTTSRLMDDFLLPTEHDRRILSDLWNNNHEATTTTRPSSNLPSITVGSTQKKKLIQPTSTNKTYIQRIQEQNVKDTTDLTTQSIIPISLLKNIKTSPHHSKQVFLSANQDYFNLTTLQQQQPNLTNQSSNMSNNNTHHDTQQLSNDTQAYVQQQQPSSSSSSLELITASPHLNITIKKESDKDPKDENKTENFNAYYIQEVEIVIERYTSSSDNSEEEEEDEGVKEEIEEEVREKIENVVEEAVKEVAKKEVEKDREVEEVVKEVITEVVTEVVTGVVDEEVKEEVDKETKEVKEEVEEQLKEVEEDEAEEELMDEEEQDEAEEELMGEEEQDEAEKELMGEEEQDKAEEELMDEEEQDEAEEELMDEEEQDEFMDVEDTFDGDDLQACLLEENDVFVDAESITEDNHTMQDDDDPMETDVATSNNDLIETDAATTNSDLMEDESAIESLDELLAATEAKDTNEVQSPGNIQVIQEDHIKKNGANQDPPIAETEDLTELVNANEVEGDHEPEESTSDDSIHLEESSASDDSIYLEERQEKSNAIDDIIHPEERQEDSSISDDIIHPEQRQEESIASDDIILPEVERQENTSDDDLHSERQGSVEPESSVVNDQEPATSTLNNYASNFRQLRAILDRQAGIVSALFKQDPTLPNNETETMDLLVGNEPPSSQSSDVTLVGSIHEAVEAPPPDEDVGFIVVDPVEATIITTPSPTTFHHEEIKVKVETMDDYLEGFHTTTQSTHKPISLVPKDKPIDEPIIDEEEVWTCRDRITTPLTGSSHDNTETRKKQRINWSEDTKSELSEKEKERIFKRRKIMRRRLEKDRIVKKRVKSVWIVEDRRRIV